MPPQSALRRVSLHHCLENSEGITDHESGYGIPCKPSGSNHRTDPRDAHADLDLGGKVESLSAPQGTSEYAVDFLQR